MVIIIIMVIIVIINTIIITTTIVIGLIFDENNYPFLKIYISPSSNCPCPSTDLPNVE